jgi:hypothetical protein
LTVDVLSRGTAGLVSACSLAARLPNQPVVLNHLGRPPLGAANFIEWRAAIAQFAAFNTYAKISGLAGCLAPDQEFRADNLRPAWEAALESFGPQRKAAVPLEGEAGVTTDRTFVAGVASQLPALIGAVVGSVLSHGGGACSANWQAGTGSPAASMTPPVDS